MYIQRILSVKVHCTPRDMYTGLKPVHHVHMSKRLGTRKNRPIFRLTFIRKWREYREKTLEEVAAKIGTTHATLSRIERGLIPYQQPMLELLAKELGTDVTSLLNRDPRVSKEDPDAPWRAIWDRANSDERKLLVDIAKTVVKTGT